MQNCQKLWLTFGFDHLCQIFEKLFAKNMKGGSGKSEILCVGQLACAEKKSRKLRFFPEAPFMGQISSKYFFKLYRQKIFAVSFKSYIQLVLKISFTSFLQPAWIEIDSILNPSSAVGCVQLVPNIYQKWNWTEDNLQIFCLK